MPGSAPRINGYADGGLVVLGCANVGTGRDLLFAAEPDDGLGDGWVCWYAALEGHGDVDGSCHKGGSRFEIHRIAKVGGNVLISGLSGPEVEAVDLRAPPTARPQAAGVAPVRAGQAAHLGVEPGSSYFTAVLPSGYDTCRGFALTASGDGRPIDVDQPRRSHDIPLPASRECGLANILALAVARMVLPWI